MVNATPTERIVLRLVKQILDEGAVPTMEELARRMGITKAGVQRHMTALRDKGHLVGPRIVGTWGLTRSGTAQAQKKDEPRA